MPAILVRPAKAADLSAINDIYNHYVRATHITFDIEPWSLAQRQQWFEQFDGKAYQLWVAVIDGQVEAFAYTTKFRPKAAYNSTAEVTIYAHHEISQRGLPKGIGKALYNKLLNNLTQFGLHRLYAVIALPNDISIGLHEQLGFKKVGILEQVGMKFGRYISVAMLEKRL